jgi:hypothetical protein
VCTPRKRIEVLLSERNPEPSRTNRLQTLPHGGLPKLVALRGRARQNPDDDGGRAFALFATQPAETARAKQPDETQPGESHPDETWIDPLYLFGCGLSWRKQRTASAGWELVNCLRSSGQTARIAAALLAQTENLQLPARELVRVVDTPRKPPMSCEPAAPTSAKRRRG